MLIKTEVVEKMHSAIQKHSIAMDERGYGDFLALIYFICKIVNISTPDHISPTALYELIWSYDGLTNTSSEFVTMSIDMSHKGDVSHRGDPHVIGLYRRDDDSIELYDNQSFMYESVLKRRGTAYDSATSYITIRNSDEIREVLASLDLTPEFQTLKIRKKIQNKVPDGPAKKPGTVKKTKESIKKEFAKKLIRVYQHRRPSKKMLLRGQRRERNA